MKKRRAKKILTNWPRFCYTHDQLYCAYTTLIGKHVRQFWDEKTIRHVVWSYTEEGQKRIAEIKRWSQ